MAKIKREKEMKPIIKELDRLVQQLSNKKRCAICGRPAQCTHHIIRRDDAMARYDRTNLMFVCQHCHDEIHNGHIDEYKYIPKIQKEFLNEIKKISYKDFLIFVAQQTETEYLKSVKKKLKEMINE